MQGNGKGDFLIYKTVILTQDPKCRMVHKGSSRCSGCMSATVPSTMRKRHYQDIIGYFSRMLIELSPAREPESVPSVS